MMYTMYSNSRNNETGVGAIEGEGKRGEKEDMGVKEENGDV